MNDDGYFDWLDSQQEELIILYGESLDDSDAPDYIYEGVLDDDYPEAFENWVTTLEWKDVPDEWLHEQWVAYNEDM